MAEWADQTCLLPVNETQPIYSEAGQRASAALGSHAWREAFDLLADADRGGTLTTDDLELYAQAAWWVGQLPVAIEVRERAYAAHLKADDRVGAATAAIQIGRDNLFRSSYSIAAAWLSRAERLLDGVEENLGHGWLAATRAFFAGLKDDGDTALEQANRALAIATRFGNRDLEAMALSEKGVSLVHLGRTDEGLALIDEATVAAVAGEIEPQTAGGVCCATIETCAALGDWRRVAQWTEAQDRWCKREQINGYPGMCRIFRAEVKRMQGSWLEAESEARRAADELPGWIPAAVGLALFEIALIRLRRGDLPAAEQALTEAHAYGRDPEPALSLLRLAQGRTDAAREGIRRALEEPPATPSWWAPPGSQINRLSLLPAQVEIALASGDLQTARAAADELTALEDRFPSETTRAAAASARGSVQSAEGNVAEAARELRTAIRLWGELDAPYDGARARTALAEALMAGGAAEAAAMELQAARATFERIGAVPDQQRVERLLSDMGSVAGAPAAAERAERAFMFTDIVDSTRLAETLGDAAWNDMLRWHDETLRSLAVEHGGEEVKRTGDGFFLAFGDAGAALACAIAIQRRLAGQRRDQGFAPAVRIGVHLATATRSGLDYVGTGVHVAARIGAAAAGGEILGSATTLDAIRGRFAEQERRTIELKGVADPIEVVSIDWR
jgi:class 3 adenylate cyclase